ncbi:MAG: hypothetical protein B7Z06_04070 [Flavobacteriales bacterium 32-35-8]|nr:MAG: hypothetical protein B7Z06_04070 [Flavobacteriales bacterium 32-35-8]
MSVEHDSVVARPTFARTMQIEEFNLPGPHHNATLPSTINAKGATVSNVVHPAFRNNNNDNGGLTGHTIGDTGSFLPGEFGDMSSPSTRSRPQAQNKIVEIDVPSGNNRNKANVGFVSAPGSPERSVNNRSVMSSGGDRMCKFYFSFS